LIQFGHGLLAGTLVLDDKLLVALDCLLLQLLASKSKLLLHLGQSGLLLLLSFGGLLPGLGQNLLALEPGLIAQLGDLPLGLLADRSAAGELFPFPFGGGNDLIGLLFGLADEVVPLTNEIGCQLKLIGQALPEGIHHLNGILLIDQTATAERDATAFQHHLLQLIQLVEHGD
jgi:hypothetical protein